METSDKVRVGIIGTSWWAQAMYLPSLKSHPRAEIVAICGRNETRAAELAKANGIQAVFTDYRRLFEAKLDAAVISVPDDLHYAMTMDALDAGLHVLCEKPLANSAADAGQMYEKALAAGVKHMVLYTWRWQPHWRYLKQLIEDGFIGRSYQARFAFLGGGGRQTSYQWRMDGGRANGVAGDLGSHMVDFVRWYLGDVKSVSANLPRVIDRSQNSGAILPANDAAFLVLEMEGGTHALVQASAVAHVGDQMVKIAIELQGDAGTLEAEHVFFGRDAGVSLRGIRADEKEFRPLEIPEAFFTGIERGALFDPYSKQSAGPRLFVDAILNDQPATPDFRDGLKVQEVIDAALLSHDQGRRVRIG